MTMNRRRFLGAMGASAMLPCAASGASERPNIVLILADDLGYGDLGVYGHKINRTPNLDRLALEGVRFTDFHSNGPMCTPTRAAIMTGRYQNRLGREFENALSGETGRDHGLPLGTRTLASAMKQAGYSTAMYGKWHLGYHPPFLPPSFGFDDFRGSSSGDGDHHSHIDREGNRDWWHNNQIEMEKGYSADLVTDHSVAFIERNKRRPFFLYMPHQVIHFPWQGPDDEGYRVEGKSYHDLSKLGRLKGADVGIQVRKMVEAVDRSVGRIVAALERNGLAKNTLVFFTSDNGGYLSYQGGYHNISSNGPLRGQKGDVFEGGHRVPAIARWPGRIKPGVCDATAMSFDLFPTFTELAGAAAPASAPKPDGASLRHVLLDRSELAPRAVFWRMGEKRAVRQGEWKLVAMGRTPVQLYNLKDDIGESRDLASTQPELTAKLVGDLKRWEADVDGAR